MDEFSAGMQAAGEAVKAAPGWLDCILETLDKYNLLPMTGGRKKNLRDKAQIEFELAEQKRHHERTMEMADAEARTRIALMEGAAKLALEATEKEIANGVSYEEASQRCLPFAVRATSNLYRETLQSEYSKERIGLYAIHAAAEAPDRKCTERNVSETWNAQFWDYAKNIRDEEAMQQWGRLLAAEVKNPGLIPIKVLDTLRILAPEEAKNFYALQKYSLSGAVPLNEITQENLKFFGLTVFDVSLLESNSLIMLKKTLNSKDELIVSNRFYKIKIPSGTIVKCIFFTDIGFVLSVLSNNTEEESLDAARYFVDYLKKYHSITAKIEKISR